MLMLHINKSLNVNKSSNTENRNKRSEYPLDFVINY